MANPYYQPPPPPPQGAGPATKPESLFWAVRGMYAGAVLSFIGVLITPLMRHEAEDALHDPTLGFEESGTALDTDRLVTAWIVILFVVGLVITCVWIWMAIMNDRGRSWARITGTVFGGVHLASTAFTLIDPASTPLPTLVLILLTTALVVAILVLLWRPASSAYYRARAAQRR